jgi:hypothetical protein
MLTAFRIRRDFPSFTFLSKALLDRNWNGSVDDKNDAMHYTTFLDRFKKLSRQLLDKDRKFETHSCRKTCYLLGAWGGGNDPELINAMKYKARRLVSCTAH